MRGQIRHIPYLCPIIAQLATLELFYFPANAHTLLTVENHCSTRAQRNLDDASLAKGEHPEGDGAITCSGNTIP